TQLERPLCQKPLQLAVNEWVSHDVAGRVRLEHSLDNGVLYAGVLRCGPFLGFDRTLGLLSSQDTEEFREVPVFHRCLQLLDFLEGIGFDLELNRFCGCVFHQRVTRPELKIAGDVTDAENDVTTVSMGLPVPE